MKHLLLLVWALHLSLTAPQECEEKDIRITNESVTTIGNSYSVAGGLQMCVNNQWATVCQSGWSDIDATVACRQLGLNYTGDLCQDSCFGNVQTNPAYHSIKCTGSEGTLHECNRSDIEGCRIAAGVYCVTEKQCEEKELRMNGGRVTRNGDTYYMAGGFVMCVNGQWATVCQNQWNDSEATVACRQLGLKYTSELHPSSCRENFQANRAYQNIIGCSGSEDTLYECNRSRNTGCTNVTGVYCVLNRTSLVATCDENLTAEALTTTSPDNSSQSSVAMCPLGTIPLCPQCTGNIQNTSFNTASPAGKLSTSDEPNDSQRILCRRTELALGITVSLMGVILIGAIIILVLTCFKLQKLKLPAGNWSLDNNTYGTTEDLLENAQLHSPQDDLISPYSTTLQQAVEVPQQTQQQNVPSAIDSFYDTETAGDCIPNATAYSILDHVSVNTIPSKMGSSTSVDGKDPIYHSCEIEEPWT